MFEILITLIVLTALVISYKTFKDPVLFKYALVSLLINTITSIFLFYSSKNGNLTVGLSMLLTDLIFIYFLLYHLQLTCEKQDDYLFNLAVRLEDFFKGDLSANMLSFHNVSEKKILSHAMRLNSSLNQMKHILYAINHGVENLSQLSVQLSKEIHQAKHQIKGDLDANTSCSTKVQMSDDNRNPLSGFRIDSLDIKCSETDKAMESGTKHEMVQTINDLTHQINSLKGLMLFFKDM